MRREKRGANLPQETLNIDRLRLGDSVRIRGKQKKTYGLRETAKT